jgi:homoserine dehydrogenase
MAEQSLGITLLGCGTVGAGVAQILTRQRELLTRRTGVSFDVRHVFVRDPANPPAGAKGLPGLPLTADAQKAIDDPRTQVVIELLGGTGVAYELVKRALSQGKPVVTANKALLATKGPELFALARKNNTCVAFEASVGGGIPIIDAMQRGLVANRVDALLGIVNGTCNFILSQMTQRGWSYEQALKEAQAQGFAEADPTMDVSGRDTLQKLAVLASLAFNVRVEESDIHLEGIDTLNAIDIKYADELGYVVKLLAIAERQEGEAISLRVHPTLVHKDDQLAQVSGSFNAISFYGHALGHALFYGRGAGRMPTASAVVADLVGVGLGTTAATFKSLRVFPDQTPRATVLPFERLHSRYYLRLTAKDQPGVLAQVTKVLGDQKISIASFVQHEVAGGGDSVPLVLTTHRAEEGAMRKAIRQINGLETITAPAVFLRIVDQPKEFSE